MNTAIIITTIICITVLGIFAMLMSIAQQTNRIDENKHAAEAAREMQKLMLMTKDGRNVKDPAQTLSDDGDDEIQNQDPVATIFHAMNDNAYYESEVTPYATEEDDENYNF